MGSEGRSLQRYYHAVAIIEAIFAMAYYAVAIAHYPLIAPASQTTTLTTLVSSQPTVSITATSTELTTSTSTTIATATTTEVEAITTTQTTIETTTLTTSSANVSLFITIIPEGGWVLLPDGTRYAVIPVNETEGFTVRINNTGQVPIRLWGMTVNVGYDGSYTFYDEKLLQPGDSVDLPFVFGTNIPRPSDVTFSNIVFKITGDGWYKDELVIIYLAH